MTKKIDKYDRAIAYLTKHPHLITRAWYLPAPDDRSRLAAAHCLFADMRRRASDQGFGCLTQIRVDPNFYRGPRGLHTKIARDKGIPKSAEGIRPKHLQRFAYWQRLIDELAERR